MNQHEMENRCREFMNALWDDARADTLFTEAANIVRQVVGEPFDGDHIRTEPTKDALINRFLVDPPNK
jgi:hypothetical protein